MAGVEDIEKALANIEAQANALSAEVPDAPVPRAEVTVADLAAELDRSESQVRRLINRHFPGVGAAGRFAWDTHSDELKAIRRTLGAVIRAGGKVSPALGGPAPVLEPVVRDREPVSGTVDVPLVAAPPPASRELTFVLSAATFERLRQQGILEVGTDLDHSVERVTLVVTPVRASRLRIIEEPIAL